MQHTAAMRGNQKNILRVLSRRQVVGGLLASVPSASTAQLLPRPRPEGFGRLIEAASDDVFATSGLSAVTAFTLRDLSNGRVLEQHNPRLALPPASVTKIATALYGRDALGENHRFATQVMITGPVRDGEVQGDLYLLGGGDPVMDTDGLANLAKQVAGAGINSITGRFFVFGAALPRHYQIDNSQPIDVGYNPAICGMNLNFNRVYFQWKRTSDGISLQMTARSTKYDTPVRSIDVSLARRASPVFDLKSDNGLDRWSVASSALNREGSRWLPVRAPDVYAGEVFRALAHSMKVRLPDASMTKSVPSGSVVAQELGAEFTPLMRTMLKYSTNLTAEVTGLRAAQANGNKPRDIAASSSSMTSWLRRQYGVSRVTFKNHSGLTDRTRLTADEMVQILDIAAHDGFLGDVLREFALKGPGGKAAYARGVNVQAKTGTLNYTRGLSGYLNGKSGKKFAFAIFAADLDARAGRAKLGPKTWLGKARGQEQALLQQWALKYAG